MCRQTGWVTTICGASATGATGVRSSKALKGMLLYMNGLMTRLPAATRPMVLAIRRRFSHGVEPDVSAGARAIVYDDRLAGLILDLQ